MVEQPLAESSVRRKKHVSSVARWNIRTTEHLNRALEKALELNHVTKSDFIREAVREKLAKLKLLNGDGDNEL